MRRAALIAALVAAGAFAAPAVTAFSPDACAQDKDKDKDKDDKKKKQDEEKRRKDREKQKREKVFKDIGGEFGVKDVSALLQRVAKGETIKLTLGGNDDTYSVNQARGVLKDYFDKFQTISVEFTKADENVGSFDMTLRRKGDDKERSRKLYVTIGSADASGNYPLLKLAVEA